MKLKAIENVLVKYQQGKNGYMTAESQQVIALLDDVTGGALSPTKANAWTLQHDSNNKRSQSAADQWKFGGPGSASLTGRKPYTSGGGRSGFTGFTSRVMEQRPSPSGHRARRILNRLP